MANDLYTVLASRSEPRPEPDPAHPRPGSTTTASIETFDHERTASLLQAFSP